MKTCPRCGGALHDDALFCTNCGHGMQAYSANNGGGGYYQAPPQYNYAPAYDPYDHTDEFDSKDISDNKIISMLVYLMGWIGIVIALLAAPQSPYAAFHLRQALKIIVLEILIGIIASFTFWIFFIPVIAAAIMYAIFFVVRIICFFQICSGKAIEPYIVRGFKFFEIIGVNEYVLCKMRSRKSGKYEFLCTMRSKSFGAEYEKYNRQL